MSLTIRSKKSPLIPWHNCSRKIYPLQVTNQKILQVGKKILYSRLSSLEIILLAEYNMRRLLLVTLFERMNTNWQTSTRKQSPCTKLIAANWK